MSVRSLFVAVALAAAGLSFTLDARRQAPRPNLLLITLDTVRADRLGAYGYGRASTPNLDELSRSGIRFDDATSQSPLTGPAHAALLSGLYPGRLGIRNNASRPVPDETLMLAEAFAASGYRTGAFIGAFVVDRAYGFGQGFEVFDANFENFRQEVKSSVERRAADVIDPAIAWVGRGEASRPFFAWVHLYDAHTPYAPPEPFRSKFKVQPYDGEIAYVDAQVGRLLAALRAAGAMENTIIAVVGDHGESLGEHHEDDHGIFLYDAVMRIPLIMRVPAASGGRIQPGVVSEQVRSIDLAPTLLELAGLPRGEMDGESLATVMRGRPRRDVPASYSESWYPQLHFGWSRLRALRVGEWKFIDAPRPELYDLRKDRAERQNVIAGRGSVAARMSADLDAIEKGFGAAATVPTPQPDAETVARLRSLGYVGLAAPSSGSGRGPDPKDKIVEMKAFRALLTQAGDDLRLGRSDAAIAKLKRAVALNERAYDAHVLLGSAWQEKGDFQRALDEFDAAALLNPVGAAPHLLAANVFLETGRLESAMARATRAAELEPASGEVALMRGRIYERAGRGHEALTEYQRAVRLNSADTAARGRLVGVAMNLGRHEIAEPQLEVLLKRKYQLSRTYFALGQIAQARGRNDEAASHYREALKLEPGFAPATQALASLKEK